MAIKNPWLEQWDNNPLYRLQFKLNCGVLNSIVGLNKSRSKILFFKLHTEYVTLIFFFFLVEEQDLDFSLSAWSYPNR